MIYMAHHFNFTRDLHKTARRFRRTSKGMGSRNGQMYHNRGEPEIMIGRIF